MTKRLIKTIEDHTALRKLINDYVDGASGATAARPASPTVGQMFFDTSLATGAGKPIWWNGTTWVDATGAAA